MRRLRWLGVAIGLALPLGAAPQPTHRLHPEVSTRIAGVKTVGLVPPRIGAWEIGADGRRVANWGWAEDARRTVATSLERRLKGAGFAVTPLAPGPPDALQELDQVALLYGAVARAIVFATYENDFPWKLNRFEYSVGDVERLVASAGVDALVLCEGEVNVPSPGRVLRDAFASPFATALPLIDSLSVALVDRTGAVLWFNRVESANSDLRVPVLTEVMVHHATGYMPEVRR